MFGDSWIECDACYRVRNTRAANLSDRIHGLNRAQALIKLPQHSRIRSIAAFYILQGAMAFIDLGATTSVASRASHRQALSPRGSALGHCATLRPNMATA